MLKRKLFLLIGVFLLALNSKTIAEDETVNVGLYYKQSIQQVKVKIQRGNYQLFVDGKWVKNLKKHASFQVSRKDSLEVKIAGNLKKGKVIQLKGLDYVNHFTATTPQNGAVAYDDDLKITLNNYRLQLVNEVGIENYVSAVVEGEAGYKLPPEFYKLQAILSRTYALKNTDRHAHEGFNVCDKVHCQVYHHKCTKASIYEATVATNSLVVVDDQLNLINTIFHSNCGGETCNSEDVWNTDLSYLRAVKDSFCLASSKALWKKEIPTAKLNQYFKSYHASNDSLKDVYAFCQVNQRWANQKLHDVKLTKIRKDFALRSTYFYIENDGDTATIYGRGYGHGVGLCQQGGIEMALRGYSYVDILKHYYQGINILNQKALMFFRE